MSMRILTSIEVQTCVCACLCVKFDSVLNVCVALQGWEELCVSRTVLTDAAT